jgi:hypothetical protein
MGVLGDTYDTIAGAADHAAGSTDEAFARQFDDDEGGGYSDFFTGDDRSDFVLQPGTVERSVYDTLFDYSGEWGGEGDTGDLPGPSIDFDQDTPFVAWRNPDGAQNDPTNPENWGGKVWVIVAAILVLPVVYIVGQLFTFTVGDSS